MPSILWSKVSKRTMRQTAAEPGLPLAATAANMLQRNATFCNFRSLILGIIRVSSVAQKSLRGLKNNNFGNQFWQSATAQYFLMDHQAVSSRTELSVVAASANPWRVPGHTCTIPSDGLCKLPSTIQAIFLYKIELAVVVKCLNMS